MANRTRNDFLIPTLGVLFDAIAIEFSFLAAYWLRFRTDALTFLAQSEATPLLSGYVLGSFFIVPVWLLLFNARKMYGARRNVSLADEFVSIVRVVSIGMLIVMSAAFFYRDFSYSRLVFGLLWALGIVSIFVGRATLPFIEKSLYQRGRELRRAVIIGSNETAQRIYDAFHKHPLLGYELMGYFSDRKVEGADSPSKGFATLAYLGQLKDVPHGLELKEIELALIALDTAEHSKLNELVNECEGVNVEFMLVPDVLELMTSTVRIKEIEGIPFIRLKGVPMTTWGRLTKRMFDVTFSVILLVILSPILFLAAVSIKLTSKGTILFRQQRIGVDGMEFEMLKFRSMVADADKEDRVAGLGLVSDNRITTIGKILRKTSIDELPQLINVFKGDMSLVGPRPERPYYVEKFGEMVPKYLDRHRLKTGMTGWAQVNGLRGNTSLADRIRFDIYYIENWSLWFDIKILLKTFGALLPHKSQEIHQ